jgi:hypothetical protein
LPTLDQTRRRYHIQGLITQGDFPPIECQNDTEHVDCPACGVKVHLEGFIVPGAKKSVDCDECGLEFPIEVEAEPEPSFEDWELDKQELSKQRPGAIERAASAFKQVSAAVKAGGIELGKTRNVFDELHGIIPEPKQDDDGKISTKLLAEPVSPHGRSLVHVPDFTKDRTKVPTKWDQIPQIKMVEREAIEQEFRFRVSGHVLEQFNDKKGGLVPQRTLLLLTARLELAEAGIHIADGYLANIHESRLIPNYNPKGDWWDVTIIIPMFTDISDGVEVTALEHSAHTVDSSDPIGGYGNFFWLNELALGVENVNLSSGNVEAQVRQAITDHMRKIVQANFTSTPDGMKIMETHIVTRINESKGEKGAYVVGVQFQTNNKHEASDFYVMRQVPVGNQK